MKSYNEIQGPSKAPQSNCVAFYKYDGMNFRAEWSKKRGWAKFGTRHTMIDDSNEQWGRTIPLFMSKYSRDIEKVLREDKDFRGIETAIVFTEMFTDNSFAGWFPQLDNSLLPQFPTGEEAEMKLIDVSIHKKGMLIPRDFIRKFGHLDIPDIIYEGNFSKQFIKDVWEGKYDLKEGVVAKGVLPTRRGNENHGLWMAKAKTKWWLDELRKRASESLQLSQFLSDNIKEQCL